MVVDSKVVYINWNCPDRQLEVMMENAALMPFEDILHYAKQYIFYRNYSDKTKPVVVTINEIRLNYMRIARKDHENEFLYVPVWDFIGQINASSIGEKYSLVTVNAIDGSFIDRVLGY